MAGLGLHEDSRYIYLRHYNATIVFDKFFGCTPLEWFWEDGGKKTLLTNSFSGSGCSMVCNNGQDMTQATANGTTPNPAFSSKEVKDPRVTTYELNNVALSVTAGGVFPVFVLSTEAREDVIYRVADGIDHGWCLPYFPQSIDPSWFGGEGAPIFFRPKDGVSSGILMIGDELKDVSKSHLERLWCSQSTDCGLASRITFNGGPGFAGLLLLDVQGEGVSQDIPYNSCGYRAYINTEGALDLWRNQVLVARRFVGAGPHSIALGITGNAVDISINGQGWIRYVDADPIPVKHMGFFASGAEVEFRHRKPFDSSVRLEATYFADELGFGSSYVAQSLIDNTPLSGVKWLNMPALFMNQENFPVEDRVVAKLTPQGWKQINDLEDGLHEQAFVIGARNGLQIRVDTKSSTRGGHVLGQRCTKDGEFVLHLNPLRPMGQGEEFLECARVDARWRIGSNLVPASAFVD